MTIADIVLEIYSLCDADSTSYPAATMLRRINASYEKIIGKIMCQDGNWEFDDTNFTNFPRGKTTMVASQNDYSFDVSHLAIEGVQVKDNAGIWQSLIPISKDEMGMPVEEFEKTAGLPIYYDKDGGSILLYPAPSAGATTLVSGLQIHFRRTADIFTSAQVTTGTKLPGFASPYHIIICYETSIPFCQSYKKDRVALYEKKSMDLMSEMLTFYSKRERDVRNIMSNKGINFR